VKAAILRTQGSWHCVTLFAVLLINSKIFYLSAIYFNIKKILFLYYMWQLLLCVILNWRILAWSRIRIPWLESSPLAARSITLAVANMQPQSACNLIRTSVLNCRDDTRDERFLTAWFINDLLSWKWWISLQRLDYGLLFLNYSCKISMCSQVCSLLMQLSLTIINYLWNLMNYLWNLMNYIWN
jgi:hypothetical protein